MRLVLLLLALEEEVVVSKHRAHNTESKEFRRWRWRRAKRADM